MHLQLSSAVNNTRQASEMHHAPMMCSRESPSSHFPEDARSGAITAPGRPANRAGRTELVCVNHKNESVRARSWVYQYAAHHHSWPAPVTFFPASRKDREAAWWPSAKLKKKAYFDSTQTQSVFCFMCPLDACTNWPCLRRSVSQDERSPHWHEVWTTPGAARLATRSILSGSHQPLQEKRIVMTTAERTGRTAPNCAPSILPAGSSRPLRCTISFKL